MADDRDDTERRISRLEQDNAILREAVANLTRRLESVERNRSSPSGQFQLILAAEKFADSQRLCFALN